MERSRMKTDGYCPFRISTENFQAGCVLQLGGKILCYSQEQRPLLSQDEGFFCPKVKFTLSPDTYAEIEQITHMILTIQDTDNTCYNLWPMLTGVANPKHSVKTEIERLMHKHRHDNDDDHPPMAT
jgi:hypothetical protein